MNGRRRLLDLLPVGDMGGRMPDPLLFLPRPLSFLVQVEYHIVFWVLLP